MKSFRERARSIENLHEFVEHSKADVDALGERNNVETNRVFKLGATMRVLVGYLGHNGVSNGVTRANDHIEVCGIEELGED